jgi:hypothetical protein
MKYIVYINGDSRSSFIGYSMESVANFIRENDAYNRQVNGWNCKLDDYEIVTVRLK